MRMILLNQGANAWVSDEDYDRISEYRYKLLKDGDRRYAVREDRDGKLVGMHQDVLGLKPGLVIDHANGNGLDNTRRNLRYATRSQNQANSTRTKSTKATSQYKGVTTITSHVARITVEGKSIRIGSFKTAEEAAKAYDQAARSHFGEFAEVNFP